MCNLHTIFRMLKETIIDIYYIQQRRVILYLIFCIQILNNTAFGIFKPTID